ncbi:MAG TPA: cytochrome c [Thermoanaerobaculia bacterium]|nr:cytochrome c [Thermoanaerobaculia bacterium]
MKRASLLLALFLLLALTGTVASAPAGPGDEYRDDGFATAESGLAPNEIAGAEIWYKATAGSARFTTYTFQQRLGVIIDWYRVLRADQQGERFKAWGLMHDPDCCVPGSAGCPAKSMDETYGFEYCRGDENLLKHVGKPGYRDPACDFKDPDGRGNKQSPCDLQFGTSTGALGVRKFPNPRFDAEKWKKVNGRLGTWEGFNRPLSSDPNHPDFKVSHLSDPSIEPPYLIGMACGMCHIAFNPLHPPKDPANPRWENLKGAVGNQYTRVSEIFASGMPKDSPEWQLFAHDRPGTVDTSAMPNDSVHNPGTMNAIINIAQRPTFPNEKVLKWRPVVSCAPGSDADVCWCEPGKTGKCKERKLETETVHHILKGGEDSIGVKEAIQRVYFNIGSCAESCWLNHLTDARQLDPNQRNFGQTEFEIGQCRRDCPGFRAIEDRLDDVVAFFGSRKPTDLWQARGLSDPRDLIEQLDQEYGKGAVDRGRAVFAQNCARCHSSQSEPFDNRDFLAKDEHGNRIDWLGNDKATPASEVGTYRCRALHSNHMKGHVFGQYGSETYHERPGDPNLPDATGGGRGYYRNISLINVWAYAPFMHNNALGPEICGRPAAPAPDFYVSSYVEKTADGYKRLPPEKAPKCWPYDPSVENRYAMYKASMEDLLNPDKRVPKVTLIDDDIFIEMGLRSLGDHKVKTIKIRIPSGQPAGLLVSFDVKKFALDVIAAKTNPDGLKSRIGPENAALLTRLANEIPRHLKDGDVFSIVRPDADKLMALYSNCTAAVENAGHPFGGNLPESDKKALTAYLATF